MSKLRNLIVAMRDLQFELGGELEQARKDASRQPVVAALRRQVAKAVGEVEAEVDHDPQLCSDPELDRRFRKQLGDLRARISVFQAKWPVSLLDGNPDFDRDADELREKNREFMEWARNVLRV